MPAGPRCFCVLGGILAVLGLIAAPAGAHPANVASEQYERFLGDCSDDWGGHSAIRDGHDLVALDMTERWLHEYAEPGFFVLLTVGFGFAQTGSQGGPLRDEIELGGPDGPLKVRIVTNDNKAFAAEAAPGFLVPDVMLPPRPSLYPNGTQDGSRFLVEFGFRYSTLGLSLGEKIPTAKVQAWARQDKGDYMPGGYFLAGVEYAGCDPSGSHGGLYTGVYVRKDYAMRGTEEPYLEVSLDTDALAVAGNESAVLGLAVKNVFANEAQKVSVTPVAPPGWEAELAAPSGTSAGPLAELPLELRVRAASATAANGTLVVFVDTDFGGHAEREVPLYWYPAGVVPSVPATGSAESSAPGLVASISVAVAAVGLAVARRREP